MSARVRPVAVPMHASCWNCCHSLLSIAQGFLHHFMKSLPHGYFYCPLHPTPHFSAGKRSSKVLCQAGCDH